MSFERVLTVSAAVGESTYAGIRLKILSGDDPIVVKRLAGLVGLNVERVLSGIEVAALSDEALAVQVQSVDAYGRLAPDQKSRIVKALQAKGAIVGFLGDGINDAPALKIADIGLSVEGATGVAQAAADMILLASDLEVVSDGVEEGRRTFANILKYVRMGASSNVNASSVDRSAVPPHAADANSSQQFALRFVRTRHPTRWRASGGDSATAGLGYERPHQVCGDHGTALLAI
jgi:magnesium-transporting ATPase (P-type)